MTKDEIINCKDGQALADAVAVDCLNWFVVTRKLTDTNWYAAGELGEYKIKVEDWQPHQHTEQGKAQAIDLADKYDQIIHVVNSAVNYGSFFHKTVRDQQSWQIAVLKAALLSVKDGEL